MSLILSASCAGEGGATASGQLSWGGCAESRGAKMKLRPRSILAFLHL